MPANSGTGDCACAAPSSPASCRAHSATSTTSRRRTISGIADGRATRSLLFPLRRTSLMAALLPQPKRDRPGILPSVARPDDRRDANDRNSIVSKTILASVAPLVIGFEPTTSAWATGTCKTRWRLIDPTRVPTVKHFKVVASGENSPFLPDHLRDLRRRFSTSWLGTFRCGYDANTWLCSRGGCPAVLGWRARPRLRLRTGWRRQLATEGPVAGPRHRAANVQRRHRLRGRRSPAVTHPKSTSQGAGVHRG